MKKLCVTMAAVCSLAISGPAAASTYVFDITGDFTAHFTLDSNPAVNSFPGVDNTFWITNVAGISKDVYFYTASIGGGLGFKNTNNSTFTFVTDGPQLFTGLNTAPTFSLGTFALTQFGGPARYSLTISDPNAVTGAVPEPATWAMMLLGFGGIGFAMRRTAKRTVVGVA
jgi:hypothetical protein